MCQQHQELMRGLVMPASGASRVMLLELRDSADGDEEEGVAVMTTLLSGATCRLSSNTGDLFKCLI